MIKSPHYSQQPLTAERAARVPSRNVQRPANPYPRMPTKSDELNGENGTLSGRRYRAISPCGSTRLSRLRRRRLGIYRCMSYVPRDSVTVVAEQRLSGHADMPQNS